LAGEQYVALYCSEMPDVRFEDLVEIKAGNQGHQSHIVYHKIEDTFLQICDKNSIKAVSALPSMMATVAARVQGENLIVMVEGNQIANQEFEVMVRLSGIRSGTSHMRYLQHTYEQMINNNNFWDNWKS